MNVAEFIEWLKTQDQGATVEVIRVGDWGYQGPTVEEKPFDPSQDADYTDLRGNPRITSDKPYFNKRTLVLGQNN